MSNKTYDILKIIALLAVPILTLIGAICSIWNVPYTEQITATLAAIETCLGGLVVVAKKLYDGKQKGE